MMKNRENKRNIIVDLDGTLAFDDHRRKLILLKGWQAYFEECHADVVNESVLELMRIMYTSFFTIHIFTGRSEIVKRETLTWLMDHNVPYHNLIMRKEVDCDLSSKDHSGFRCDTEVKLEMLQTSGLSTDNVLFMLDDRDDMTKFWREQGFDCFQVREQGFMILPE